MKAIGLTTTLGVADAVADGTVERLPFALGLSAAVATALGAAVAEAGACVGAAGAVATGVELTGAAVTPAENGWVNGAGVGDPEVLPVVGLEIGGAVSVGAAVAAGATGLEVAAAEAEGAVVAVAELVV